MGKSGWAATLVMMTALSVVACAPTAPPPGAPNGCGSSAAPVYLQQRLLLSSGVVRTFLLTIPDTYGPSVPSPLILNFHGSGSNAVEQSAYSQLDLKGKARGFIVATPDGVNGLMDVTSPSADVVFVEELVRYLDSILCVSPTRRFSAGMSLGGLMSTSLACEPELNLRGIAGVTAMFGACANGRSMPVLAFHGTLDRQVPYSMAEQAVASWADRNGCRATPRESRIEPDIQLRTYLGCGPGLSAALYTVENGGHTWPGGLVDLPVAVFGLTTHTIDASDLILDFFNALPDR